MIRNLKVLGLAIGAVLAMSAIASSSASAAPEFTCAEGGVHVSCKFIATTEPNTNEQFVAGITAIDCHNSYEGSDADGTATKLPVANTKTVKPFDAPVGATVDTDCESTLSGSRFTTKVNFNGCGYEFHAKTKLAANEYTAEVDVVCPAGKTIHVEAVKAGGEKKCTLEVGPQTGLNHVILKNTVNPTTNKEDVTVNATVEKVKYTQVFGGILGCGRADGTYTDATYSGKVTVEAFNTLGKAIDGTVAGE